MSVADVANQLVRYCRNGQHTEAVEDLYSDEIVSVEPVAVPPMEAETRGKEGVLGKNRWWLDNNDVHHEDVSEPMLGGNTFAVRFAYDMTFKPTGENRHMEEVGLYTVAGGKIVREEFFYNA